MTPFEKLNLVLSVLVEHIIIRKEDSDFQNCIDLIKYSLTADDEKLIPENCGKPSEVSIKFNFMDYKYRKWRKEKTDLGYILKDNIIRIGYSKSTYFGDYDLA